MSTGISPKELRVALVAPPLHAALAYRALEDVDVEVVHVIRWADRLMARTSRADRRNRARGL